MTVWMSSALPCSRTSIGWRLHSCLSQLFPDFRFGVLCQRQKGNSGLHFFAVSALLFFVSIAAVDGSGLQAQLDGERTLATNLSFPSWALSTNNTAPLAVLKVPNYDASNVYLHVDMQYEFFPAGTTSSESTSPEGPASAAPMSPETLSSFDWSYQIHSSQFEKGFDEPDSLELDETLHVLKGVYMGDFMAHGNSFWFFSFKCSSNEADCALLRGTVRMVQRFTLKVDQCAAHMNKSTSASACEQCASMHSKCGYCVAGTPFHGCWDGRETGPAYSNRKVCGTQSEPLQGTWLFKYTPDVCPQEPSMAPELSLTSILVTFLLSLGCVGACLAVSWRLYQQQLDDSKDDGDELSELRNNHRPHHSHDESESLFEYDHTFQFPDDEELKDDEKDVEGY